jgi:hypothetical protein
MSSLSQDALTLHGGCDCTSIRFTISIPALVSRPVLPYQDLSGAEIRPPQIFLDHCNKCRRVSGALVQGWLTCPQDWVEWAIKSTSGEESPNATKFNTVDLIRAKPGELPVVNYASSEGVTRSFCGNCGTNLAYVFEGRKEKNPILMVDIVLGSLDTESLEMPGVRPERQFYWNSGVEWIKRLVTEGDSSVHGEKLPRHPDGSRIQVV